jgi:hypothetical protein
MGESLGTTMASASGAAGSLADVDEVGAGGLRKDRRRLADEADVDRADVQAFQQLRAGRELDPLHGDAQRRQALFVALVQLLAGLGQAPRDPGVQFVGAVGALAQVGIGGVDGIQDVARAQR